MNAQECVELRIEVRPSPETNDHEVQLLADGKSLVDRFSSGLIGASVHQVEVRSVSGFSGSPVFVYDFPNSVGKGSRNQVMPDLLLGIDCGHLPEHEKQLSAGIAAVVPAWRLLELLEHPDLQSFRAEQELKLKAK